MQHPSLSETHAPLQIACIHKHLVWPVTKSMNQYESSFFPIDGWIKLKSVAISTINRAEIGLCSARMVKEGDASPVGTCNGCWVKEVRGWKELYESKTVIYDGWKSGYPIGTQKWIPRWLTIKIYKILRFHCLKIWPIPICLDIYSTVVGSLSGRKLKLRLWLSLHDPQDQLKCRTRKVQKQSSGMSWYHSVVPLRLKPIVRFLYCSHFHPCKFAIRQEFPPWTGSCLPKWMLKTNYQIKQSSGMSRVLPKRPSYLIPQPLGSLPICVQFCSATLAKAVPRSSSLQYRSIGDWSLRF